MRDPRKPTYLLLLIVVLGTIFLDYWDYSAAFHKDPDLFNVFLRGQGNAPQQYRIGVLQLGQFLSQHTHLALRHCITFLDLIGALLAPLLLVALLRRSPIYRAASLPGQWFACISFVFLVQFYFGWALWYQRPETFTTALSITVLLWLLSPDERKTAQGDRGRAVPWGHIAATLAVAFLQALVRADIVITFEAGVVLLCLLGRHRTLALSRWVQAGTSAAAVLIAGGTQLYIMHVLYPQATYGDIPVFQLKLNVTDFMRLVPFTFFMVPYAYTLRLLRRTPKTVENAAIALIPGSLVFLLLWCFLGRLDEVRIILPYTLALAPLTVLLFLQKVEAADPQHVREPGAAQP